MTREERIDAALRARPLCSSGLPTNIGRDLGMSPGWIGAAQAHERLPLSRLDEIEKGIMDLCMSKYKDHYRDFLKGYTNLKEFHKAIDHNLKKRKRRKRITKQ